jgi:hemerythrin
MEGWESLFEKLDAEHKSLVAKLKELESVLDSVISTEDESKKAEIADKLGEIKALLEPHLKAEEDYATVEKLLKYNCTGKRKKKEFVPIDS